jgi:hypothetical protein
VTYRERGSKSDKLRNREKKVT